MQKSLGKRDVNHQESLRGNHRNLALPNHRLHLALHEEDFHIFFPCGNMGFKCIRFEGSTLKYSFLLKNKSQLGIWTSLQIPRLVRRRCGLSICDSKSAKHPVARAWAATRAVPAVLVPALATEGSRLGVGSSGNFFREKGHLRP